MGVVSPWEEPMEGIERWEIVLDGGGTEGKAN